MGPCRDPGIPGSRTAGHSGEDGQVGQDRDGPAVAGGKCIEGGSFQGSKVVIPYIIYINNYILF